MGTYWISKCALSRGVFSVEAQEDETFGVSIVDNSKWNMRCYHGEGREWHRTEQAARNKAEAMRVARLASLRKQIVKLEKLTFVEPSSDSKEQ